MQRGRRRCAEPLQEQRRALGTPQHDHVPGRTALRGLPITRPPVCCTVTASSLASLGRPHAHSAAVTAPPPRPCRNSRTLLPLRAQPARGPPLRPPASPPPSNGLRASNTGGAPRRLGRRPAGSGLAPRHGTLRRAALELRGAQPRLVALPLAPAFSARARPSPRLAFCFGTPRAFTLGDPPPEGFDRSRTARFHLPHGWATAADASTRFLAHPQHGVVRGAAWPSAGVG